MKILPINSFYENRNKNTNFKAYDINAIRKGLQQGKVPDISIIREIQADAQKAAQSSNIKENLEGWSLSVLATDLPILLQGELRIKKETLQQRLKLKMFDRNMAKNAEEKMKIQQDIDSISASIKEIDKKLEEANKL